MTHPKHSDSIFGNEVGNSIIMLFKRTEANILVFPELVRRVHFRVIRKFPGGFYDFLLYFIGLPDRVLSDVIVCYSQCGPS